jgi:hypothetical protein
MINRDECYNKLLARGFYFDDDQIFDTFLVRIKELSKINNTPVENYYNAFEKKLDKIEGKKGIPAVGSIQIKVIFKEKRVKDSVKKYKITKIEVLPFNEKYIKNENSRY